MANDYDNTDKGAAFAPFDTQRLILQGKINDSGKDMKIVLIKDQTKAGKNLIEVYERVGTLFENDKKGNESAPDYTGPLNMFRRLAAWRRMKDGGKPYMTFSVSDQKPQDHQATHRNDPLDDEIPPF